MRRLLVIAAVLLSSACGGSGGGAAPSSRALPQPAGTSRMVTDASALGATPSVSSTPSPSATVAPYYSTPAPVASSPDAWVYPDLATVLNGRLYGLHVGGSHSDVLTALDLTNPSRPRHRIVATGELPDYYFRMASGQDGLYATTSVIRRFTQTPDEILRIDPETLAVVAKRTLPVGSAAGLVVRPDGVDVADLGTVLRLDPVTLRTLARYDAPAGTTEPFGDSALNGLSSGSTLWISYGSSAGGVVFRLDPLSLHRLPGSWPVPKGQSPGRVVATTDGAWRNDLAMVARLLPGGAVGRTVRLPGDLQSAVPAGQAEAVLTDGGIVLLIRDNGPPVQLPHTGSDCGQLVSDARTVWLLCESNPVRIALP